MPQSVTIKMVGTIADCCQPSARTKVNIKVSKGCHQRSSQYLSCCYLWGRWTPTMLLPRPARPLACATLANTISFAELFYPIPCFYGGVEQIFLCNHVLLLTGWCDSQMSTDSVTNCYANADMLYLCIGHLLDARTCDGPFWQANLCPDRLAPGPNIGISGIFFSGRVPDMSRTNTTT